MDTIVEFVGLCVFTTQILSGNASTLLLNRANPSGQRVIIAILPAVPLKASNSTAMARTRRAATSTESGMKATQQPIEDPLQPALDVEPHTAMIAFRHAEMDSVHGWTVHPLYDPSTQNLTVMSGPTTVRNGWDYIELSGEHLSLSNGLRNGSLTLQSRLSLPKLGHTLSPPYTPPGYSGAAAVFTILSGTLSTCVNSTKSNGRPGRVDTKLTLPADKLTITAVGSGKSITFKKGAHLVAGNIPLHFAMTHEDSGVGQNHYLVYCAMTGQSTCMWPPTTTPNTGTTTGTSTDPNGPPVCENLAFRPANSSQPPRLDPDVPPVFQEMVDFACSNSQWP